MAFTARVTDKEIENGVIRLMVEFTDGETTITENVRPQDAQGLDWYVKGRLAGLNFAKEANSKQNVDLLKEIIVPIEDTTKQRAQEWNTLAFKYVRLKQLVEAGLLSKDATEIADLKASLESSYSSEFFSYL